MDGPGLDKISNLVNQFLDVQSRRAQIVAGNLANADTPGYTAQELDFNDYLKEAAQQALQPSDSQSTSLLTKTPQVVYQNLHPPGLDGNNVDAGQEMATLSEAGMQYLTGATMLQFRLRTLRAAIKEGK